MFLSAEKHVLQFIKPAKTSRGSYTEKTVWLLSLRSEAGCYQAEIAPLHDLSADGALDFDLVLSKLCGEVSDISALFSLRESMEHAPSIRFGLDTLIKKVQAQNSIWINSTFTQNHAGIAINGLVWMNDIESMEQEANTKVSNGFNCIKFKIGAHDFDEECRLLERFRKKHLPSKIQIRLDANGAFHPKEAISQLKDLHRFEVHSIEQPIAVNQWEDMGRICSNSPINIALDEELIGFDIREASRLLREIQPQYLILKPTLIGGFDRCDQWIKEAEKHEIGWWSTSALEGNIGLFDIAQWVSQYSNPLPQGLGTGSLFVKNFDATTKVENGFLYRI